MKRKTITLVRVENDREITKKTDREFWLLLEKGLLLALREKGWLTEGQYSLALKKVEKNSQQVDSSGEQYI